MLLQHKRGVAFEIVTRRRLYNTVLTHFNSNLVQIKFGYVKLCLKVPIFVQVFSKLKLQKI